jgi:Calcineurin-like phosphoesterase
MQLTNNTRFLNQYYSKKWLKATLPEKPQAWIMGPYNKSVKTDKWTFKTIPDSLRENLDVDSWQWPKRVIYFFSDMHADADAFMDSLLASGGVIKTGPKDKQFKLSKGGKKARFILGGDCFDKGPSTLRLLRLIKLLIDKGADVTILAGNHDTRTLVGMLSLSRKKSTSNEHFFVRMGLKPLPLLKQIYDTYFAEKKLSKIPKRYHISSDKKFRKNFFPSANWPDKFPDIVKSQLSDKAIIKEVKNTCKKAEHFEQWCEQHDINLKQLYMAVQKWQELFLSPKGEFYWFFKQIQLATKEGSFLFVHAGADDLVANTIRSKGLKGINKRFRKYLKSGLCELYYGALGNMIRTKYRETDRQFTKKGTLMLRNAGINVIVHGHRNLYYGQRIMLRKGMVNFECDTSLDIHTRKKEGVSGYGASVTIIRPEKLVLGISSDYPYIKVFQPWLSLNMAN